MTVGKRYAPRSRSEGQLPGGSSRHKATYPGLAQGNTPSAKRGHEDVAGVRPGPVHWQRPLVSAVASSEGDGRCRQPCRRLRLSLATGGRGGTVRRRLYVAGRYATHFAGCPLHYREPSRTQVARGGTLPTACVGRGHHSPCIWAGAIPGHKCTPYFRLGWRVPTGCPARRPAVPDSRDMTACGHQVSPALVSGASRGCPPGVTTPLWHRAGTLSRPSTIIIARGAASVTSYLAKLRGGYPVPAPFPLTP